MNKNQGLFLGTYQLGKQKEAREFIKNAISVGVRNFDTAPSYGTEKVLGTAVQWAIEHGIAQRKEFIIIDKIDGWQMQKYSENITELVDYQLKLLKTEYIDIILIHWPFFKYFASTWNGLQKIKGTKVKQIGICNIDLRIYDQLKKLLGNTRPDVIQVERHPYNSCLDLCRYFTDEGIIVQAYSPVCRMKFTQEDFETLNVIGYKYNKSVGQVILKWHLQTGAIPIVKTNKVNRIKENAELSDFFLNKDDINAINNLNKNYKLFPLSWGCPGI